MKNFLILLLPIYFFSFSAHGTSLTDSYVINTNGKSCKEPNKLTSCILGAVNNEMQFDKMIWSSSFLDKTSQKDLYINVLGVKDAKSTWYRVTLKSDVDWSEQLEPIVDSGCAIDMGFKYQAVHTSEQIFNKINIELDNFNGSFQEVAQLDIGFCFE